MTTFWPKRDEDGRHITEPKPLSELLAKLDPDVVERAQAAVSKALDEAINKNWLNIISRGVYPKPKCKKCCSGLVCFNKDCPPCP